MTARTLVIGPTGNVGRELIKLLLQTDAKVVAATRRPDEVKERLAGAELVHFDLDDPSTHAAALRGVERVFLMTRQSDPRPDREALPIIEEMKRQGVEQVVTMTGLGILLRSGTQPLRTVEIAIENSGMGWTHLRPNYFMQNFLSGPLLADLRDHNRIMLPAARAAVSFVDARDIAAVAAEALTSNSHLGKAYAVTGGVAVSYEEIARSIAEVSGRPIVYVEQSEDDARKALLAGGLPPDRLDRRLGGYRMVRENLLSFISTDVADVLGRPQTTFQTFAADHAEVWRV